MSDNDAKLAAQRALLEKPGTPRPGQQWKHWKGDVYFIVAVSLREDDLEPLVTYASRQYGIYGTLWTRTLVNFLESVEFPGAPGDTALALARFHLVKE